MNLKEVTLLGSRTRNFEKLEISIKIEVSEGEKLSEIVSKSNALLQKTLDVELAKIVQRQEKEKEKQLEEERKNRLPETVEEAGLVVIEDKKIDDYSRTELSKMLGSFPQDSKEGYALRMVLGINKERVVPKTQSRSEYSISDDDSEFLSLDKEVNPRFFKNGAHGFADATQSEISRLSGLNNKDLANRLIFKARRYAELATARGLKVNYKI